MNRSLLKRVPVVLALIVAVCGFLFIRISREMLEGETLQFDKSILLSLRHQSNLAVPIGPHWLLPAAQDFSALGSVTLVTLLTVVAVGYFIVACRLRAAVYLSVSMIGATIMMAVLKVMFARPRPEIVPHLTLVADASFPSGHSMIAAVFYLTLSAMIARTAVRKTVAAYFLVVSITISVVVGLTRVFLGVHYPTDVLAGWCVGVAWASGSYLLASMLESKITWLRTVS